jgi:hypothetical protein
MKVLRSADERTYAVFIEWIWLSCNSAAGDHMLIGLETTLAEHEHELIWLPADPVCAGERWDPRVSSLPERTDHFQPRPGIFA